MKLEEMMRRPIPSQQQMMDEHIQDVVREALEEGRGLSPEVHNRVMSLGDDQFEKLVSDPALMKAAQDEYDYAEDSGAWSVLNDKVVLAALQRLGYM